MPNETALPTAGIITFHKSLSYGGCLQAYASQLILEDAGYCVVFVDYENPYEARRKSNVVFRYGSAREKLAAVVKKTVYRQDEYQRRAFSAFHSMLPVTPRSYTDPEGMGDVEADVLVVASDQVWSPKITGGVDPAFFLGFGRAKMRISLASSLGSHRLSPEEREECACYLGRFDAVSVREEFAREQVEPLCPCGVHVALDPTLQIEPVRWREAAAQPPVNTADGGYILVFMVSSSPARYERVLEVLRERLGAPVVMVRLNSKRPRLVDEVLPATPFELVWLIDHASLVLTDSFHGLAFSVNMETPFLALSNRSNNVRLAELLDGMGLSARMLDESKDEVPDITPPDFTQARAVLAKRRELDAGWLSSALGEVRARA